MNRRAVMTAMAIFVAMLAPASQAEASGFSFALAAMPTVTSPSAYHDTVMAVASVDGPMTVDVTALDGTTITQVDDMDCVAIPTGAHCAFTAAVGATNMIGVSGAYAGEVVHLRLAASDASGPVSFAADTAYPMLPETLPIPVPSVPSLPVSAPPSVPPITPPALTGTASGAAATTKATTSTTTSVATTATTIAARDAATRAARLVRRRSRVTSFTNAERATAGLHALTSNAQLTQSAQVYAQHLALDRSFSHSDGSTLTQRVVAEGYRYRLVGENLGLGQPTAKTIVAAWMASPEHQANMLESRFTQVGVGVAIRADGQIVWCVDFGWPAA